MLSRKNLRVHLWICILTFLIMFAPVTPLLAQSDALMLTQPPRVLNYQGYLSTADGDPFTGTLNMQASLWNAEVEGSSPWGWEAFANVPVEQGLFHLLLGTSLPLDATIFHQALWIELQIEETVLPRQPLHPAPYAFSLISGATVIGAPSSREYGLHVENTSGDLDGIGIYASGPSVGIVADTQLPDGLSIYAHKPIESDGGFRGPDSVYYFSPTNGRAWDNLSGSTLVTNVLANGTLYMRGGESGGVRYFFVPIDVPATLYGQRVTIEEVEFQYEVLAPQGSSTHISRVAVHRLLDLDDTFALYNAATILNSRTKSSFKMTELNNQPNSSEGSLVLLLELNFANGTEFIKLGNTKVRISHKP